MCAAFGFLPELLSAAALSVFEWGCAWAAKRWWLYSQGYRGQRDILLPVMGACARKFGNNFSLNLNQNCQVHSPIEVVSSQRAMEMTLHGWTKVPAQPAHTVFGTEGVWKLAENRIGLTHVRTQKIMTWGWYWGTYDVTFRRVRIPCSLTISFLILLPLQHIFKLLL